MKGRPVFRSGERATGSVSGPGNQQPLLRVYHPCGTIVSSDCMDYTYLALKFLISGGVIVGITILSQQVDPKYGGMLAAAPILTTLACVFTYAEAGQITTQQLVLWFAIPSLIFLLTLWFLLARYPLVPVSEGRSVSGWSRLL